MRCAAAIAVMMLAVTLTHAGAASVAVGEELLKNSSIEQSKGDLPADWYPCFVPGRGATFRRVTDRFYSPSASLLIECGPAEEEPVSTNWCSESSTPPAGRRSG